jgi:sugar phosphate isomerase/epimerase
MKIGLFIILYQDKPYEEVLDKVCVLGIEAVEIGAGAYSATPHCPLDELLGSKQKLQTFSNAITDRELTISALNTTGNPLHPNEAIRKRHREEINKTILLAEQLGIDTIVTMSGCPGDSEGAKNPYWGISAWPPEFPKVWKWQWEKQVIPYWEKQVVFAREHGVRKIAIEMHPGMTVYNPTTLLKLRNAVGDVIGANFDPSHLFWQGCDVLRVIRTLGNAIYHVHAKDTMICSAVADINGLLDAVPYQPQNQAQRSWLFCTVGYGHDVHFWKQFVSTLRLVGYDHVLSIEHEDLLMSRDEGLGKGIECLMQAVLVEPNTDLPM